MALKLLPLPNGQPIADKNGVPSLAFTVYWQQVITALQDAVNTIETTLTDIIDLNDLITTANSAIAAAEAAIADANVAIVDANVAIADANAAAAAAQSAADDGVAATALQNSWVTGATITGTDAGPNATVTISAHTRNYADGTSVAVNGGAVTGLSYSTSYFIYYDDPARTGGAVTYQATTTSSTAAQVNDRHSVGGVITPVALGVAAMGRKVEPPGYVELL